MSLIFENKPQNDFKNVTSMDYTIKKRKNIAPSNNVESNKYVEDDINNTKVNKLKRISPIQIADIPELNLTNSKENNINNMSNDSYMIKRKSPPNNKKIKTNEDSNIINLFNHHQQQQQLQQSQHQQNQQQQALYLSNEDNINQLTISQRLSLLVSNKGIEKNSIQVQQQQIGSITNSTNLNQNQGDFASRELNTNHSLITSEFLIPNTNITSNNNNNNNHNTNNSTVIPPPPITTTTTNNTTSANNTTTNFSQQTIFQSHKNTSTNSNSNSIPTPNPSKPLDPKKNPLNIATTLINNNNTTNHTNNLNSQFINTNNNNNLNTTNNPNLVNNTRNNNNNNNINTSNNNHPSYPHLYPHPHSHHQQSHPHNLQSLNETILNNRCKILPHIIVRESKHGNVMIPVLPNFLTEKFLNNHENF